MSRRITPQHHRLKSQLLPGRPALAPPRPTSTTSVHEMPCIRAMPVKPAIWPSRRM